MGSNKSPYPEHTHSRIASRGLSFNPSNVGTCDFLRKPPNSVAGPMTGRWVFGPMPRFQPWHRQLAVAVCVPSIPCSMPPKGLRVGQYRSRDTSESPIWATWELGARSFTSCLDRGHGLHPLGYVGDTSYRFPVSSGTPPAAGPE